MAPYSKKILDETEEQRQRRLQQGQEAADIVQQQGEQYVQSVEAAQAAQAAADNAANESYNNVMAKYNNDFAAMVQGESDRIRAEQQQAQQQLKASQNAAKYSGLTELAASVANLIGVGAGNAVSQQYRQYSQDWMRKADQDMREHRLRMDNIRARQNALKQQQLQIQMGQAGQALENARRQADRDFQNNITLAGARRDAAYAPVQARQQAQKEADELYTKGLQTAASQANHEQQLAQSAAQFNARMAAQGLNPDGTPNEGLMRGLVAAQARANGGTGGGDNYDVVIDGKPVLLSMSKQSYEQGIRTGTSYLKKDLREALGFNGSWSDFVDKVRNDRKGRNYGADIHRVVEAIEGTDDDAADFAAIERYIKDNSDAVNNVNKHLARTANNSYGYIAPSGSQSAAIADNAGQTNTDFSYESFLNEQGSKATIAPAAMAENRQDKNVNVSAPTSNREQPGKQVGVFRGNPANRQQPSMDSLMRGTVEVAPEVQSAMRKLRAGEELSQEEQQLLVDEMNKPQVSAIQFGQDDMQRLAEELKKRPTVLSPRNTLNLLQ